MTAAIPLRRRRMKIGVFVSVLFFGAMQTVAQAQGPNPTSRPKGLGMPPGTALRALTEIRYYHLKQLLNDDEATSRYAAILGSRENAVVLAAGKPNERKDMLEQWLKCQRR